MKYPQREKTAKLSIIAARLTNFKIFLHYNTLISEFEKFEVTPSPLSMMLSLGLKLTGQSGCGRGGLSLYTPAPSLHTQLSSHPSLNHKHPTLTISQVYATVNLTWRY